MSDNRSNEFAVGIFAKPPHENAPDFVKMGLSLKRAEVIGWLQGREGEWVNLDVKVSREGKWYVAVNNFKPKEKTTPVPNCPQDNQGNAGEFSDDVPF